MIEPSTATAAVLGRVVVMLAEAGAERWAAGDLRGAETLSEAAWKLCENRTFTDADV